MTTQPPAPTLEAPYTAEEWLRHRYGAYRGHFAWRELEQAFEAGRASLAKEPASPIGWITSESMRALMRGGNGSKGTVPIHATPSAPAKWPVYAGSPPSALSAHPAPEPIRCPERLKNGGSCPHHNLHCGWPKCNEAPKGQGEKP